MTKKMKKKTKKKEKKKEEHGDNEEKDSDGDEDIGNQNMTKSKTQPFLPKFHIFTFANLITECFSLPTPFSMSFARVWSRMW